MSNISKGRESMAPNASNGTLSVFYVTCEFVMTSIGFFLQLHGHGGQLGQLNEPFFATIGVVTHLRGGTAHEDEQHPAAFTQARPLVPGLLTRFSHTHFVEASTRPASQPAAFLPLEHP